MGRDIVILWGHFFQRKEYKIKTCSFPGCTKKVLAKGLCTGHYQQLRYKKQLTPLAHNKIFTKQNFYEQTVKLPNGCIECKNKSRDGTLIVNGKQISWRRLSYNLFIEESLENSAPLITLCGNPDCVNPYHIKPRDTTQLNSINDPIPLENIINFWKNVKKTDTCWIWQKATRNGYGCVKIRNRMFLAHRVAYRLANGFIPEGFLIDHICRNPLCVNPLHLRPATYGLNRQNTSNHSTRRGGEKNVKLTPYGTWEASVCFHGKTVSKTYKTFEEAKQAAIDLRNKFQIYNEDDRHTL